MMTPVQMPETDADTRYNEAHVATHSIVERCIGLLKIVHFALVRQIREGFSANHRFQQHSTINKLSNL